MAGSGSHSNSNNSSGMRSSLAGSSKEQQLRSNSNNDGAHKTWINFSFENCVSIAHEGLPGSPDRYRIRVRMDSGYKLADLTCAWAEAGAGGGQGRRHLRLSATASEAGDKAAAVKATKSFEVLVEPLVELDADAKPSVTTQKDKDECWIEFPVAQLPASLPVAQE